MLHYIDEEEGEVKNVHIATHMSIPSVRTNDKYRHKHNKKSMLYVAE